MTTKAKLPAEDNPAENNSEDNTGATSAPNVPVTAEPAETLVDSTAAATGTATVASEDQAATPAEVPAQSQPQPQPHAQQAYSEQPYAQQTYAQQATAQPQAAQAQAAPDQPAPVPPQYAQYPPQRQTNVLAIITLILGVLGMAIAPVITGHISLSQIKRTGEDGRVMAIIGLILGYIGVAAYAIGFIIFVLVFGIGAVAAVVAAVSSGHYYY